MGEVKHPGHIVDLVSNQTENIKPPQTVVINKDMLILS